MIEAAIQHILSTHSEVIAIAGTNVWGDFSPQQPELPNVVHMKISTVGRDLHHSGHVRAADARIQVTCTAEDSEVVKNLAAAVRHAVHDIPRGTYAGVLISKSQMENELNETDSDLGEFSVIMDVIVSYREE